MADLYDKFAPTSDFVDSAKHCDDKVAVFTSSFICLRIWPSCHFTYL